RTCIDYTRRAKTAGASAVMISPPRRPKINPDAVARHFAEVASAVDIPIIVQDYPPISGYAMEPALLARIAREVGAARTIKLEDPPTPFKTSRILDETKGLDVRIFGGLGGVFLLEELMAGAAGAMTGFGFPAILVKIVTLFRAGRIDEAAHVFYTKVALMRFEFQEGIGMAIRKEVLRRRGARACGRGRAGVDRVARRRRRQTSGRRDRAGDRWSRPRRVRRSQQGRGDCGVACGDGRSVGRG